LAEVTPTSINDAAFALKDKRSAASVMKCTNNKFYLHCPALPFIKQQKFYASLFCINYASKNPHAFITAYAFTTITV
jgi:hypothetical protein